jgi:hypothetical protein
VVIARLVDSLRKLVRDKSIVGAAERPAAWLPTNQALLSSTKHLTNTLLTSLALAMDTAIMAAVQAEQVCPVRDASQASSSDADEDGWEEVSGSDDDGDDDDDEEEEEEEEDGRTADDLRQEHSLLLVQLALSLYQSGATSKTGAERQLPSMLKAKGRKGEVAGTLLMVRAACLYTLSLQHLTSQQESESFKDYLALHLGGPITCTASPPVSPKALAAEAGVDIATAAEFLQQFPTSEDRNTSMRLLLEQMTQLLFTEPAAHLQPLGGTGARGVPHSSSTTSTSSSSSSTGHSPHTLLDSVTGMDGRVSLAGVLAAALGAQRVPHLAAIQAGLQAQGEQHLAAVRSRCEYSEGDQEYGMFLSTMYQEMSDVIYRKKQRQEEVMEAERSLLAAAERWLAEMAAQPGERKGQQTASLQRHKPAGSGKKKVRWQQAGLQAKQQHKASGAAGKGQDRQQQQQQQQQGSCHLQ